MYRPVRTYLGSARAPRKRPTREKSPLPSPAQPQPFILGKLPENSGNVANPINLRAISPITIPPSASKPHAARSPSPSSIQSRQDHLKRTMTLHNPVTLIPPHAFNPPPFPTPSQPRSRSASPTMKERVQADIAFAAIQQNLNRDSYHTLQARQAKLRNLPVQPLPVPPDGRQIYQSAAASAASAASQGGTNSGLAGYISPREFGISQANPTISQPSYLETFENSPGNSTPLSERTSDPTSYSSPRYISQRDLGIANGNPTIAKASSALLTMPTAKSQGQRVIIKEENTINYRENEHNLILYSYDRNWLENTTENRYNFTVNFDTESLRDGFRYSASVDKRYRNIVRIELIKAIIPAESLENIVIQMGPNTNPATNPLTDTDTTYQVSPLSFPYINISLQEFDGNNAGTDENLNRTFANLQYDAQWHTDLLHQNLPGSDVTATKQTTTRGFLAMIPKYMKCQRIFYPTPLATLQKMSIQFTRPSGQNLSALPDQLNISNIFANTDPTYGIDASKFGNQIPAAPATGRTVTYLFLQTSYFPRSAFSQGDRIQLAGLIYDRAVLNSYLFNGAGLRNLEAWLNRAEGHIIVGLGNNGPSGTGTYQDGPNKIGYANFIIIQSMAVNQEGAIYYESVGNSADINGANTHFCEGPRRLINMSRQTTVIFRIITRDMDSITNIRPDNTF